MANGNGNSWRSWAIAITGAMLLAAISSAITAATLAAGKPTLPEVKECVADKIAPMDARLQKVEEALGLLHEIRINVAEIKTEVVVIKERIKENKQ